ncbi:MAG: AraC family transcriptional regulator [Oscillatoriaceae cyanobacterium Prado104]|jgi:AraC family transcriptional regulator|nr:AraC family transcriptional regulator [Oscillatoriaceae cyanobacterium Prado104]
MNNPPLIFPNSPILTSDRANWKNIYFAHFRQPPCEVPEHMPSQHMICMNVGKPVRLKQAVDGRDRTVDSVPGDLGIYPAYLSQHFCWDKEVEFFNLFLEPSFLDLVSYEVFGSDRLELLPHLTALFDPLIQQISLALKTSLEIDGTHSNLYADSMTYALVVHLLSRYSTNSPPTAKISKNGLSQRQQTQVFEYINVNLDRNLSLSELAAIVQLSPYHFAHLFKASTGISPHQYLIRCRVDRAKQLLILGNLSIAAVAQTVGFASQGHFTSHFKRLVGLTPKAFLRHLAVPSQLTQEH